MDSMRSVICSLFLSASFLIACDPGSVLENADGGPPSANGDAGVGIDNDSGLVVINCPEPPAGLPSGEHNPGTACQNCHTEGGDEPIFTASGTLYKTKDGAEASPGGVIILLDSNGDEIILTGSLNGNFWTQAPIAFPLINSTANCGQDNQMLDESNTGDCNSCHGAGQRIY